MKKSTLIMLLAAFGAGAADEVITLDLTKATTPLEFETESGAWTGTFNDDASSIESQCFSFIHSSMSDWNTWWGFSASISADNTKKDNFLAYQWSNMAAGGVSFDENGKLVVDPKVPYLVGYFAEGFSLHPTDMVFNDGKNYDPQGVYINLTSYPYYCLEYGGEPARPCVEGDWLNLIIHGIAPDESEKTVTVKLFSFTDGDMTINRGWKYVDLTELGTVNEIYFTMDGSDKSSWGLNTPAYFALDKLSVKPAAEDAIENPEAPKITIRYDRATKTVSWSGAEYADVQDTLGRTVMSSDSGEMNLSTLPAGVYVVRAGSKTLKLAR